MTIELSADRFKIHASEKVSTGDYESADYHATIEGDVTHAGDLDGDARTELKARLLAVEKDAQEVVERAAENRLREPGHADWSVPERGSDE